MNRTLPLAFCVFTSAICGMNSLAHGTDLFVPSGFPTIQDAINAAVSGDRVLVDSGTYFENLTIGVDITLQSVNGPQVTTIDGSASGSVIVVSDDVIIDGFTLTNGSGTFFLGANFSLGGAILVSNSSPVIRNNIITANAPSGSPLWGPGIVVAGNVPGESATITGNEICNNFGDLGGGIIVNNDATAVITDNEIHSNTVVGQGGGLDLGADAIIEVRRNRIFDNAAAFGGAISIIGLAAPTVNAVIEENEIFNNTATFLGGAIWTFDAEQSSIRKNLIYRNTATDGGGIYVDFVSTAAASSVLIADNMIFGNGASNQGAGIFIDSSFPVLANNTITDNFATVAGGGIFSDVAASYPSPEILNSVLWNNTAPLDPEVGFVGLAPTVDFCDIDGGLAIATNSIDLDPMFQDPGAANYQLMAGSPCIDAGNNAFAAAATDFENDARITNGRIDLGADERTLFLRGDADNNLVVDSDDVRAVLNYLFAGGALDCLDAADADDNGQIQLVDAIAILNFINNGTPLPAPFGACGSDPTFDWLGCLLHACN